MSSYREQVDAAIMAHRFAVLASRAKGDERERLYAASGCRSSREARARLREIVLREHEAHQKADSFLKTIWGDGWVVRGLSEEIEAYLRERGAILPCEETDDGGDEKPPPTKPSGPGAPQW